MNYAVIIAGGHGARMGQDIPKQFINVYDKPVLVYTLESFQRHPLVDAILLVCIEGWQDMVWAYAKQFGIDKLRWIVPGGASGQESIRNGVYALEGIAQPDDIVIIHDGVRPLVESDVLTDVIRTAQYIPRETLRRVSTPQAYRFDLVDDGYHRAEREDIGMKGSNYTNTMMVQLGVRLYFAAGSDKNIKLTTKDNLEMFKAYLKQDEDQWLK